MRIESRESYKANSTCNFGPRNNFERESW